MKTASDTDINSAHRRNIDQAHSAWRKQTGRLDDLDDLPPCQLHHDLTPVDIHNSPEVESWLFSIFVAFMVGGIVAVGGLIWLILELTN